MARFVSSLHLHVATILTVYQSDPYVRVLINDVIEARTEVVNNSGLNFSLKFKKLKYLRRPQPRLGSDRLRSW